MKKGLKQLEITKEDFGMSILMNEVDRSEKVSRESVFKKLKESQSNEKIKQ